MSRRPRKRRGVIGSAATGRSSGSRKLPSVAKATQAARSEPESSQASGVERASAARSEPESSEAGGVERASAARSEPESSEASGVELTGIARLLAIMARLRDPQDGCPWDLEQDFASIAKHTLEEAYEVEDAIRSGDMRALEDELGDLLLQVVFHARMAQEAGYFDFDAVAHAISDKLVRRHPGIFGEAEIGTAAEQLASWEAIKATERAAKREAGSEEDARLAALEEVPLGLPALTRAAKLLRRAEREGLGDLAPAPPAPAGALDAQALGDALLALVARAQHGGLDPEEALRAANARLLERARARAK
jgi:uncharacterized protein YabN with tetrapyrrole methylase and pyrophosphatase domain